MKKPDLISLGNGQYAERPREWHVPKEIIFADGKRFLFPDKEELERLKAVEEKYNKLVEKIRNELELYDRFKDIIQEQIFVLKQFHLAIEQIMEDV